MSIDYSPDPSVLSTTIILQNEELLIAKPEQMERFFRVWYTDVSQYAPCLTELTLLLRPTYIDGGEDCSGIQRLLNYFASLTLSSSKQVKLILKKDNYATVNDNCLMEYADAPILLGCF